MKLFFSVGEPSGDLHGANLITELCRRKPGLYCAGFGGPRMQAAGCELLQDMTEMAVMGIGPVLARLPKFYALKAQADRYFREQRPDGVVLIDFPGFNWHIAARAKAHGIPVFYYGLPQLWAWMPWRAKKVRQYVDHALCKLSFEEPWLRKRGCNATYVGHPYFDELRSQKLDANFISRLVPAAHDGRRLVTLLPGSRGHEVTSNLPTLLNAAELVQAQVPDVRFAIASYNEKQASVARRLAAGHKLPLEVHVGRTPELISAAHVCLACSGSVSLELLYHAKPSVMVYKFSPFSPFYWSLRALVEVKYMTLVNLLAADELHPADRRLYDPALPGNEKVLFPEYPSCLDKSAAVARHAIEWLRNEESRQTLIHRLEDLRSRVAGGGASMRAADYLLKHLPSRQSISAPHFDTRSEDPSRWRQRA
ncbi:MAG: lipid-A-disaccharide synthase [Planctomycetales bacterium]|nr:lipid-A-disaccharide synthase [Planctomycetales bacterium]